MGNEGKAGLKKSIEIDPAYQGYVFLGWASGLFESRAGEMHPYHNMYVFSPVSSYKSDEYQASGYKAEKKKCVGPEVWEGLDPALFQDTGYSLLGYDKVWQFSDICVCFEPRENQHFQNMGVCVSMSGNGCRAFETMSKLKAADAQGTKSVAFPALFQLLTADETANISRIDVACDDREGYLDMDKIIDKTRSNEINSRMMKRTINFSMNGENKAGSTVYIGAPSSDFRVRIYDKALEQGVDGHWIRVELVMRSGNANAFVENLTNTETVGKLAAQVINDKFSFIERDDSNISRCTVCDWWTAFVDELDKVRLVSREVIQHGVDRIRSWVESQVAPSLYVLMKTIGLLDIYNLAASAAERVSPKQEALILDFHSLCSARAAV